MRAMARTATATQALVELKAVEAPIRFRHGGARSGDAACRRAGAARRRVRRRGRSDVAGAARSQTRRRAHHRQRHASKSAPRSTASRTSSPAASPSGRASDGQRGRVARHRSAAARQPGALALPVAPARATATRAGNAVTRSGRRNASAGRRLANPQPHQRHAGAGAQRRTLHPVPHAGRPDRAAGRRRRRRQCGEEPYRPQARRDRDAEGARRHRRPGVRDLSLAGAAAVGDWRPRSGSCSARFCRSSIAGAVRRDHPAADRAGAASAPNWRWRSVYGLLTALAFALWPLGRAHDVPVVGAVSRRRVAAAGAGRAGATSSLGAGGRALLAAIAVVLSYDRKIALIFIGAAAAVFVRAAARRAAG